MTGWQRAIQEIKAYVRAVGGVWGGGGVARAHFQTGGEVVRVREKVETKPGDLNGNPRKIRRNSTNRSANYSFETEQGGKCDVKFEV